MINLVAIRAFYDYSCVTWYLKDKYITIRCSIYDNVAVTMYITHKVHIAFSLYKR